MAKRDTFGPRRPNHSLETLRSLCFGTYVMSNPFYIHLSLSHGRGGVGMSLFTLTATTPTSGQSLLTEVPNLLTPGPDVRMCSWHFCEQFHSTPSSASPSALSDHSLHPSPSSRPFRGLPDTPLSLILFIHSGVQSSPPVLPAPSTYLRGHPESPL